jgi:hypothetical protein
MGRPRKQRHVEPEVPEAPKAPAGNPALVPAIEPATALTIPDIEFDSTIGMDLDMSFLDMNNSDLNFLNLLDPNSTFLPLPDAAAATSLDTHMYADPCRPSGSSMRPFGAVSDRLGDIDFEVPSSLPPSQIEEITPEQVRQIISAELAETAPSLSPPSSNSASTPESPPEDSSTQTCGCLAALYLAMQSLQTLPKEVAQAMAVARTAAKTAHDTILCKVCGDPPIETGCQGHPVPITSYQNMLMLGALLPSLSNAYMRILAMVDAEAEAAAAEHRQILFTLRNYGGLWGWVASQDLAKCGGNKWLEGTMLEPLLWRLTVRALLKMDVYGINDLTPGAGCEHARQPGLKDIINMMEERSRRRHQLLDQLVASGAVHHPGPFYIPLSSTGEKPTCMTIIDIAKRSMDHLVIP